MLKGSVIVFAFLCVAFILAAILNVPNSEANEQCINPVISTIPSQVNYDLTRCDNDNEIKWDYTACNEDVPANGSCSVRVDGGAGVIRWEIVGASAYFDEQRMLTSIDTLAGERSVTVYLDNACGSIEIRATDIICNQTAAGYIRSSIGQWNYCEEPDTGNVGNWIVGCTQRKSWVKGKFRWSNWCMRCCVSEEDRANSGCEWSQCIGEGLTQTTICADDIGTISCEFGICWEGTSYRAPGHMQYWECQ